MSTKVFLVASITALTGLVAMPACTSTTKIVEVGGDDGGPTGTNPDGGGDLPPLNPGDPRCNKPNPIDVSTIKYTPAKIVKGACTEADLKAIEDYVIEKSGPDAGTKATYTDLKAFVAGKNAACAACVFTPVTADAFGPIVETPQGALFYVEGCIEAASGKRECGEAYARYLECNIEACGDCKTQQTTDKCLDDTPGTSCKASKSALDTSCGDMTPYVTACAPPGTKWAPGPLIKQMCGP